MKIFRIEMHEVDKEGKKTLPIRYIEFTVGDATILLPDFVEKFALYEINRFIDLCKEDPQFHFDVSQKRVF